MRNYNGYMLGYFMNLKTISFLTDRLLTVRKTKAIIGVINEKKEIESEPYSTWKDHLKR